MPTPFSVFPLADVFGAVVVFHLALSVGAIAFNTLGEGLMTAKECEKKGCGMFHAITPTLAAKLAISPARPSNRAVSVARDVD